MWLTKGLRARPSGTQLDGGSLVSSGPLLLCPLSVVLLESEPATSVVLSLVDPEAVSGPDVELVPLVPLGPTGAGPEPPLGPELELGLVVPVAPLGATAGVEFEGAVEVATVLVTWPPLESVPLGVGSTGPGSAGVLHAVRSPTNNVGWRRKDGLAGCG